MLGKAQLVIFVITVILMVASFSMLIWAFINIKKDTPWPPNKQKCPDYWRMNSDGTCDGTTANIGQCDVSKFQDVNFGSDACQMYNWTQGLTGPSGITGCTGVRWDGISYGYGINNPCYIPQDTTS